jgi:hypothetical protein
MGTGMFRPIWRTSCGCFLNHAGTTTPGARGSRWTCTLERSSNARATSFLGGSGTLIVSQQQSPRGTYPNEHPNEYLHEREGASTGMVLLLFMVRTILATPRVSRIVPDFVFDAFGWCESQSLEWGHPEVWSLDSEVTSANPPGMVFVLRTTAGAFLPRELACLHVPGMGLSDEWALAPYAIDDATDELFLRRIAPRSLLWLAAGDLPGLVWGLHDWAHFHNHGAFEARALTELQCDATALVWLWINRARIGMSEALWHRTRRTMSGIAAQRFAEEGAASVPEGLAPWRLLAMADTLGPAGCVVPRSDA